MPRARSAPRRGCSRQSAAPPDLRIACQPEGQRRGVERADRKQGQPRRGNERRAEKADPRQGKQTPRTRSEEHTSELQSLMRISYAVFCLKKKKKTTKHPDQNLRTNQIISSHKTIRYKT